jgi:hypothetical protein
MGFHFNAAANHPVVQQQDADVAHLLADLHLQPLVPDRALDNRINAAFGLLNLANYNGLGGQGQQDRT